MRTLVTGGVRSGKSRHAEGLIGDREAIYVATGRPDDEDAEWSERIAEHRRRRDRDQRPWRTVETVAVESVLEAADAPVLVECLTTWLTRVIDKANLWAEPPHRLVGALESRTDALVHAIDSCGQDLVVVTNEVGLGVVPSHPSGRAFRDALGSLNARVGTVCDEVHLVIAGRALKL